MEISDKLKNEIGCLVDNIRESCRESAERDEETNKVLWENYPEFEEIFKFADQILSKLEITKIDHTVVEVPPSA